MLVFSLFAPGMFISSAAFLPSSFSMYFTMLAIAAWILKNYPVSLISFSEPFFLAAQKPRSSIQLGIIFNVDVEF